LNGMSEAVDGGADIGRETFCITTQEGVDP